MGLPEASIDLSVSGYADDKARAAVAKNLTELGQINREQTDSLRAALKSRSLQLHPSKGIVILRAAGLDSMKQPKRNVVRVARLRRPPLLSTRSQALQRFKVLVFKAAIVGTLLAALETAPLDANDFHHLEVKLCSLARRFCGAHGLCV